MENVECCVSEVCNIFESFVEIISYVYSKPGILRNKTMNDKLIDIPIENTQYNYWLKRLN